MFLTANIKNTQDTASIVIEANEVKGINVNKESLILTITLEKRYGNDSKDLQFEFKGIKDLEETSERFKSAIDNRDYSEFIFDYASLLPEEDDNEGDETREEFEHRIKREIRDQVREELSERYTKTEEEMAVEKDLEMRGLEVCKMLLDKAPEFIETFMSLLTEARENSQAIREALTKIADEGITHNVKGLPGFLGGK